MLRLISLLKVAYFDFLNTLNLNDVLLQWHIVYLVYHGHIKKEVKHYKINISLSFFSKTGDTRKLDQQRLEETT